MRAPLSSRAILAAAVAALATFSAGAGFTQVQAPAASPAVRPAGIDPISAAVAEASRRFGVPQSWIWSVMRVESAGRARAVSHAGAMGLMQVMPGTYADLRSRHGLGPDPFDVRDNILAGAAYLREMFDRYGATGMLAAYNAGPGRWEEHLRGVRRLPRETVNYLARLGPAVGVSAPTAPVIVPAQRNPAAVRPTLFVQVGGVSAAASVQPSDPIATNLATGRSAAPEPIDGLFARRPASLDQAVDEPSRASAPAPGTHGAPPPPSHSSPLFVPINTAPDHP